MPVLCAGTLNSNLCFFARDLGKDEVQAQQPLVGAAGKLVRTGVYKAIFGKEPCSPQNLSDVLDYILLANTVPYKPPGNKAYSEKVKKRFRPFIEKLLVCYWKGGWIIPLKKEALDGLPPLISRLKNSLKIRSDSSLPLRLPSKQKTKREILFLAL